MTARDRLAEARLYLVCDARPRAFLDAALRGGADIVQLRDKALDDDGLVAAARSFRAAADAHGALFILNDRPDLVDACAADGVHVGQDDGTPAAARALVGPDRIVGRSTHAPAQADAADADPDVDYLAVGPVHATPTKPGRPAAGLDYVAYAARTVATPWFAIGGLDPRHPARRGRARRPPRGRRAGDHRRGRPRGRGGGAARRAGGARWVSAAVSAARTPRRARGRRRRTAARSAQRVAGRRGRPATPRARRCPAATPAPARAPTTCAPGSSRWRRASGRSAVTIAAVFAALLALANVVVYLAGWDVGGSEPTLRGLLSYCVVLGVAAVGMWLNRYWAVLGFQMLLAGSIIIASLFLLRASNWQAVVFCFGVLAVCGPLFWFLIRAMARLQMPSRRARFSGHA